MVVAILCVCRYRDAKIVLPGRRRDVNRGRERRRRLHVRVATVMAVLVVVVVFVADSVVVVRVVSTMAHMPSLGRAGLVDAARVRDVPAARAAVGVDVELAHVRAPDLRVESKRIRDGKVDRHGNPALRDPVKHSNVRVLGRQVGVHRQVRRVVHLKLDKGRVEERELHLGPAGSAKSEQRQRRPSSGGSAAARGRQRLPLEKSALDRGKVELKVNSVLMRAAQGLWRHFPVVARPWARRYGQSAGEKRKPNHRYSCTPSSEPLQLPCCRCSVLAKE